MERRALATVFVDSTRLTAATPASLGSQTPVRPQ